MERSQRAIRLERDVAEPLGRWKRGPILTASLWRHGGTLSQAKPNGLIEFAGGLAAEAKSQSLKLGPLTPARSDAGHAPVAADLGSSTLPQESEGPVSRPSIVCD